MKIKNVNSLLGINIGSCNNILKGAKLLYWLHCIDLFFGPRCAQPRNISLVSLPLTVL